MMLFWSNGSTSRTFWKPAPSSPEGLATGAGSGGGIVVGFGTTYCRTPAGDTLPAPSTACTEYVSVVPGTSGGESSKIEVLPLKRETPSRARRYCAMPDGSDTALQLICRWLSFFVTVILGAGGAVVSATTAAAG